MNLPRIGFTSLIFSLSLLFHLSTNLWVKIGLAACAARPVLAEDPDCLRGSKVAPGPSAGLLPPESWHCLLPSCPRVKAGNLRSPHPQSNPQKYVWIILLNVCPQALSNQAWPIGQGIISMSPLTPRWQKEKKVKVGTGALCLPPLLTHTQLTERDISSFKRFTPMKILSLELIHPSDGTGLLFVSIRTI